MLSSLEQEKVETSLLTPFYLSFHRPLQAFTVSTARCTCSSATVLDLDEARFDTSSAYNDTVTSIARIFAS